MAYITKEKVAEIRKEIRSKYPSKDGWKWSIRGGNSSELSVRLMAAPKGYLFEGHKQINQYHLRTNCENLGYGFKEYLVLSRVLKIMTRDHWDKSDIMTDYFHCAWYNNLCIGDWERPVIKK